MFRPELEAETTVYARAGQGRRDQRKRRFSELLRGFMKRADVSVADLGRRIGMAPGTVRRWHDGETLPGEADIRKLKAGLWWVDTAGVRNELTDAELNSLVTVAGYNQPPSQQSTERVSPTDRCIVYTSRYTPETFASQWSNRIIELERSIAGSAYTMWTTLPSITRNADFYKGAYEQGLYDRDQVAAYMATHEARQAAFLQRLEAYEVHHLYSLKGIEDLLSGTSAVTRPLWDSWPAAKDVMSKQLTNIVTWLDDYYPRFEVHLRPRDVPSNVMIIGHDVVLIEFSRALATVTTDNINGLELIGADAVVQFTKQFKSFWTDRETIMSRDAVIRELTRLRDRYIT